MLGRSVWGLHCCSLKGQSVVVWGWRPLLSSGARYSYFLQVVAPWPVALHFLQVWERLHQSAEQPFAEL